MVKADENGMWNLVMFDLPVTTKVQRSRATAFRKRLIDLGWQMAQFSVYVRYVPTGSSIAPELLQMKHAVPPQGKVEVVAVTDRQWAKALRYINATEEPPEAPPDVLTLF